MHPGTFSFGKEKSIGMFGNKTKNLVEWFLKSYTENLYVLTPEKIPIKDLEYYFETAEECVTKEKKADFDDFRKKMMENKDMKNDL